MCDLFFGDFSRLDVERLSLLRPLVCSLLLFLFFLSFDRRDLLSSSDSDSDSESDSVSDCDEYVMSVSECFERDCDLLLFLLPDDCCTGGRVDGERGLLVARGSDRALLVERGGDTHLTFD